MFRFDSYMREFRLVGGRKSCSFLFNCAYQIFQKLKSISNNDNLNKKVACGTELLCDSKLCMLDCKIETIYLLM